MQEDISLCEDDCNDPGGAEDVEVRDCSIACDLSLPAEDYLGCLCDCGLTGICELASPSGSCTDACTTLMVCAEVPEADLAGNIALCEDDCNDPGDSEDVEVRDCCVACDLSLSCEDYLACVCGCGIFGVCE